MKMERVGCPLLFAFLIVYYITIPVNALAKVKDSSLYDLGEVEGKTYLAHNITQTWHEARQYCWRYGLQLASITSQTQHDFLVSKHAILEGQWHWTAGRDALTEQQFVWDHTTSVTVVRYGGGMSGIPIRTALAYVATTESSPNYGYYYGFDLNEKHRVLCERV